MNLKDAMAFIGGDNKVPTQDNSDSLYFFPTQNFFIPINKEQVLQDGLVAMKDSASIAPNISFTYPQKSILKNDLMEMNIIAANDWKRPIYFTSPYELGLNAAMRQDGLTYRLVPLKLVNDATHAGDVNVETMYNNLMYKFKFGGADKPDVYFDENGRRTLLSIRRDFATLAMALVAEGKKDSALKVLNYCTKMINPTTLKFGETSGQNSFHNAISMQFAYAYYLAGDNKSADMISDAIVKDCKQQLNYYDSLWPDAQDLYQRESQTATQMIKQLQDLKMQFEHPAAMPAPAPAPAK
jgi:hypothetical protein